MVASHAKMCITIPLSEKQNVQRMPYLGKTQGCTYEDLQNGREGEKFKTKP